VKTSSLLKNYFQHQSNQLLSFFEKPNTQLSENDLHTIRVEIKKIKSLLVLLDNVSSSFDLKKIYGPFKIIFRQAGKIRELQIQVRMIKLYPTNVSVKKYVQLLSKQIIAEKKKLFSRLTPSLIRKLEKRKSTIKDSADQVNSKIALPAFHKKEKYIQKLLGSSRWKPANLHELRKRMKEIYYWQKMLKPKDNGLMITDEFQELLGKWHDGRVLENGLKEYIKSGALLPKDVPPLESLKTKISKKNQQLFQTIMIKKMDLLHSRSKSVSS